RQQGWETVEVDLPSPQLVLSAHYAIAGYELVRYQDLRFKTLAKHGKNVQAIIKRARGYSDRDYRIALAARDASVGSAWRLFDDIDLLALPTTPTVAPEPGTETFRLDDRTVDAVSGAIWYTALFNDTGLPAVSVPFMGQRGLPIGIQLVSQWGQDNLLLDVAEQIN
ncbi:MAG: amidase family protein, partial [Pseudolysinimonas sp.]